MVTIRVVRRFLIAGLLLAAAVAARERVDAASIRRQALAGITTLDVRVDISQRGNVAAGLTANQLERGIREKVRRAGFAVDDHSTSVASHAAFLEVVVNPLQTDNPVPVYGVQVGLFQRVSANGPPREFLARIWGGDLTRAASTASAIEAIIDGDVDVLLGDLAVANPGKRHPIPDPQPVAPVTRCESPASGHAGSALRIVVKDAWGGDIYDAKTRYSRAGEPVGEYGPIAWVKPGPWRVEISARDFRTEEYDFEVEGDKLCTTTVYLEDSGFHARAFDAECSGCASQAALLVHVTDQSGAALPGVRLEIGGSVMATDSKGVLQVDGLAPGQYVVKVALAGFDGGMIPISAIAGRQTVATATMTLRPVY